MNRIFISYRSSDGKKDANRLAEDLGQVFGDDQVFFDKHDLRGGSSWRDEIFGAIGSRPIVLVVLTPDYFGATHADGKPRLADANDPVRQELGAAIETRATLMPLLGEGVRMPAASELPPELALITEKHALKLRTDDWRPDLLRVALDLIRMGVKPVRPDWQAAFGGGRKPTVEARPWLILIGLAFALVILFEIGAADDPDAETYYAAALLTGVPVAMAWLAWRRLKDIGKAAKYGSVAVLVLMVWELLSLLSRGVAMPNADAAGAGTPAASALRQGLAAAPSADLATPPPAAARAMATQPMPTADLSGTWLAPLPNGQMLAYSVRQRGERVSFSTPSIDVRNDPAFQQLNMRLAAAQAGMVHDIRIRGEGELEDGEIDAQMTLTTGDGMRTLDTGSMTLAVSPDGSRLSGTLHFSSGQPAPIALRRR